LRQRKSRHIQPTFGPEKALGKALREIRRERGLSQEQLGFESGFDRTYISLLERGLQSPTVRTIVKLALALKISPSSIIRKMENIMTPLKPQTKRS
jgi:transcriptional regulator with XRE-family HTH domain